MPIERLPFNEALEFVNDFPKEIRCSYLALMSTYPYYLAAIDHSLSFDENVQRLLFDQYGTFFTLPDQLLSNSTQIQDVYNAIMVAIAHRRTTIKSIADYIHEDDAKVSKYLSTLLASELVVKQHTFMGNKKTNYYVIGDPLLKFWYAFIFENQEELDVDVTDYSLWGGSAGARMAAWLGSYGTEAFGEDAYPAPAAVVMEYTGLSDVTGNEPPTYACVGTSDGIAYYRTVEDYISRIQENGTPAQVEVFEGLPHGFGLGEGTVAEGWLENAVDFWEENME